jgi:LytS/YehU family sensor histidine kinase
MMEIVAQQHQLDKEREQQITLEFKKKLTEMELKVLKSQLNPHFYFNTLNNLYGLTITDPKKAPDAILKLSDIMEYVIYDCKSEKVPVAKELKFISSYVELEKLRYEDSSRIQLRMQGTMEEKFISPLLLIQFIENAFKHGMEQNKNDSYLFVDIAVKNNHLLYHSVNSTKEKARNMNGVGLSNVQKRLNILYPDQHTLFIREAKGKFEVELDLQLS